MACSNLICTGTVVMPNGNASVGQILKSTRVCMNPHNSVSVPNSGTVVCTSVNYTPVSTNSLINVTFTGCWQINGTASVGHGQWYCSLKIAGMEIGTLKHGTANTSETIDSSPIYGQYTNNATSALTISVEVSKHFGNQSLVFVSQGGSYKTTCFHIEEVQA